MQPIVPTRVTPDRVKQNQTIRQLKLLIIQNFIEEQRGDCIRGCTFQTETISG